MGKENFLLNDLLHHYLFARCCLLQGGEGKSNGIEICRDSAVSAIKITEINAKFQAFECFGILIGEIDIL